jgi:hypothetical protein
MGAEKTLRRLLSGTADAAIRFDELCHLLESLGLKDECEVVTIYFERVEWRR